MTRSGDSFFKIGRALAPTGPAAAPGAVPVTQGAAFGSYYTDETVVARAAEQGTARFFTPAWGQNKRCTLSREVRASAYVLVDLYGGELDRQLVPIIRRLEEALAKHSAAEHAAILALQREERAQHRVLDLEDKFSAEDIAPPDPKPNRTGVRVAGLGVLGLGEVYLSSPAFQVLNVADSALIPGLPFTYQHLTGITAIGAIIALAHSLAEDRTAADPEDDDDDDGPQDKGWLSPLTRAGHGLGIVGAAATLIGLAGVREAYLSAKGSGNFMLGLAFVLLNLGLLLAARYLAEPDRRAYAVAWESALSEQDAATEELNERRTTLVEMSGEINGDVAEYERVLSQFGHAARASRHNATRLIQLAAGTTQLHQPEMVSEEMHPEGLPKVKETQLEDDIDSWLTNREESGPYHPYTRIKLEKFEQAQDDMRARLDSRILSRWSGTPATAPVQLDPDGPSTPPRGGRPVSRSTGQEASKAAHLISLLEVRPDALDRSSYNLAQELAPGLGMHVRYADRVIAGWQKANSHTATVFKMGRP